MESNRFMLRHSNEIIEEQIPGKGMLKWFYNSSIGKVALHVLIKRKIVSALGGWFMNSSLSKKRIATFIQDYKMDMSEYVVPAQGYATFNEFFYRKVQPTARPIGTGVVSPADGKVLAFQNLDDVRAFFVKGSEFTVPSFLNNDKIAQQYKGGAMLIVRLAPTDYHRFHFPAKGQISDSKIIKGFYYSVSPLALQKSLEIFCQNQREFSVLQTDDYGDILISEVGATMVGSIIHTYQANSTVDKGDEKGYFAFGGSTVVLLFEKGKVTLSEDLLQNTKNDIETVVKMGETIGH